MTLFRNKLAYSENQASKNLKLYRVKQKEVELAQAKAAGLEDALETVRRENFIQRDNYVSYSEDTQRENCMI